jgi:hypothetical protein
MTSVFLSHSSKDKAFTRKLAEKLRELGVRVWIDEAEINIGDSLQSKIAEAIEEPDYVAAVISHNSVQSSWVQRELQMAMSRELEDRAVRVLPILIEPCELPPFLRDKLYADFSDPSDFDAPFAKLLRALQIDRPLTEIATPPTNVSAPAQSLPPASSPQSNLSGFVDISIAGVDKARTYNPDPAKALFNVYFNLSAYPPSEWVEIFDAERRFPRHTMWRKAWIDGDAVVVYCVPEEVKKYHLKDIQQDVASANSKYRDYLHRQEQMRAREAAREIQQRNNLNSALDDLDL